MSPQSATVSNQLPLLKRLWGNNVAEPLYKRSKFLAAMAKDTSFGGEGRYVNVTVGPTSGGSADFATALSNQGATKEIRFFVTHRKEYQIFSIQGDLIARARGDKNAVLEAVKQQADKARYSFARAMARRAWGNGGGSLGQISSTSNVATTTITLANRADVAGFEPGMYVTTASDDGSAASPAGTRGVPGAQLQIVSINRLTGTLTANAAWNTIAGTVANDYIHRAGDYSLAMTGVRGWCPVSDPSPGENFFGVDRTLNDIQRQSGIRVAGNSGSKEETLIQAGAEAKLAGAENDLTCYVNPLDEAQLVKELGSKVVYKSESALDGRIGFNAIMVHTPAGVVKVVSEVDVLQGYGWMVDPSEFTLRTAGDCPMMLNEDGVGKLMRSATDDAYQGRLGAYGNIFGENPGHVVTITW